MAISGALRPTGFLVAFFGCWWLVGCNGAKRATHSDAWSPGANSLVVGHQQVCVRTRPGQFDCAGDFANTVQASILVIRYSHVWFRRDTDGQWWGKPNAFDSANINGIAEQEPLLALKDASALEVGEWSSCLVRGGKVYCWGFNEMGQLGARASDEDCYFMKHAQPCSRQPIEVPGMSSVVEVVGEESRCARLEDQSVWCWGGMHAERTSKGTPIVMCENNAACTPPLPRRVERLAPVTQIVSERGILGVDTTGQVHIWGHRKTQAGQFEAEPINGFSGVKKLSANDQGAGCALLKDGHVQCWEADFRGKLDDVSQRRKFTPVPNISDAVDVAVSTDLRCALRLDRAVWCWGAGVKDIVRQREALSDRVPERVLPVPKSAAGPAIAP